MFNKPPRMKKSANLSYAQNGLKSIHHSGRLLPRP